MIQVADGTATKELSEFSFELPSFDLPSFDLD